MIVFQFFNWASSMVRMSPGRPTELCPEGLKYPSSLVSMSPIICHLNAAHVLKVFFSGSSTWMVSVRIGTPSKWGNGKSPVLGLKWSHRRYSMWYGLLILRSVFPVRNSADVLVDDSVDVLVDSSADILVDWLIRVFFFFKWIFCKNLENDVC